MTCFYRTVMLNQEAILRANFVNFSGMSEGIQRWLANLLLNLAVSFREQNKRVNEPTQNVSNI